MFWKTFSAFSLGLVLATTALAQEQPTTVPVATEDKDAPIVALPEPKQPTWWERFFLELERTVRFAGFRLVGYHNHRVTGDREAWRLSNYGGLGPRNWSNRGTLRVSGDRVFGFANFDANLTDARLSNPQDDRYTFVFGPRQNQFQYGDVRSGIGGDNRFVQLNRSLRGLMFSSQAGNLTLQAVRSESKGQARTVSVPGNNTAGPYYLQTSQIVRGSERILIDDQPQVLGQDYIIDYEVGAVTFVNRQTLQARSIPVTSTIVATYEAFSFSGNRGTIDGVGLVYEMGRAGRLGLTYTAQSTGSGGGASARIERFQGFGPPGTPYTLQFEPLTTQPITIRIDGVIQVLGIDYIFDAVNPAIFYTTRTVTSEQTIEVAYTPVPRDTISSDRQATALSYRYPLPRQGFITLSQALGRTVNTPTGTSGTARALEARFSDGPAQLSASFRDVPRGFVSIDALNFQRTERTGDLRLTIEPGARLRYGLTQTNASITTLSVGSGGALIPRLSRLTLVEGFYQTGSPESPFRFTQRRVRSRLSSGPAASDRTGIETRRQFGPVTLGLELSNESLSGGTPRRSAQVSGLTLRTDYAPAFTPREDGGPSWTWRASLSAGFNRVRSQGTTGQGKDILASLNWSFGDRLSLALNHADSDSGALSTLGGLTSGFGEGFTGGTGSNFIGGANRSRSTVLTVNYAPTAAFTLFGNLGERDSLGVVGSNTKSQFLSLGGSLDTNRNLVISGSLSFNRTRFVGSPIRSDSTVFDLRADGSRGRWNYSLGATALLSSGSQFSQDIYNFDGSIGYVLSSRENLIFNALGGGTRGYLPQSQSDLSLVYSYRFWQSLTLNVGYRFQNIQNQDPNVRSGAYRSRGFDIELGFNVARF